MPTILKKDGFRVYFYSADWHEPIHVHIEYGDASAKFWMEPISVASSRRMRPSDLRRARRLLEAHEQFIKEKWDEYFGSPHGS